MDTTSPIPQRDQIPVNHTWDLESLYTNYDAYEKALTRTKDQLSVFADYQGKLKQARPDFILSALDKYYSLSREIDKLMKYSYLSYYCNGTDTQAQELMGHASYLGGEASTKTAFFSQEMSEVPLATLEACCKDPVFSDYHIYLRELIRSKAHILSLEGEQILAAQRPFDNSFNEVFDALLDIDVDFGSISTPEGEVALTQASLGVLLEHKDREVRRSAYEKFFSTVDSYRHSLTKLYASQVLKDKSEASTRKYESTLHKALFGYNIDTSFYTKLLELVESNLPSLHKWYAGLAGVSKLDDFAIYDTRAPYFFSPQNYSLSYESAVEILVAALIPLGSEYCSIARNALLDARWVDRYESKGKQSGAFSMPTYGEKQFILINYRDDSFDQLFTLAHELGHSMHSYFSAQNNPYSTFQYTIFEAEVASTVNEMLLYDYLLKNPEALGLSDEENRQLDVYLRWQQIQDFCGTFFRQIMFSEFEYRSHEAAAKDIPLTVDFFCNLSKELQAKYYGETVALPESSRILGLRIPHFYRSFYVYQYSTGIASAVDISGRILDKWYNDPQSTAVRDSYLTYLKNGGRDYPLDSLKKTGVDFEGYKTIQTALTFFDERVEQLIAKF